MKSFILAVFRAVSAVAQVAAGWVRGGLATLAAFFGWSAVASAQVSAPTSQAIIAGLGASTSGSETGIYEIQSAVSTGLGVVLAIVLITVGYMVVIKMIRRVGRRA